MELAKEKGSYMKFEGSEWETGRYFERKGYNTDRWNRLMEDVAEVWGPKWLDDGDCTEFIHGKNWRVNRWNRSFYAVEYAEEKKNFKFKVTAPDLNHITYDYYRRADMNWIKYGVLNKMRRDKRHIDQAISFNLYVRHDIKAKDLLNLHMEAWKMV